MGKVISFEDNKPCPTIVLDLTYIGVDEARVIPVEMFKNFVCGDLKLSGIERAEPVFRLIVKDWLAQYGIKV